MSVRGRSMEPVASKGVLVTLQRWSLDYQAIIIALSLIVAVVISCAWLAFPYLLEGQGILSGIGNSVQDGRRQKAISIGQFLTRYTTGPGEAEVDVLYATPTFFEVADKARQVADYRPDRFLVFVVIETTHIQNLPAELPKVTLIVDGKEYVPVDVEGPVDVIHHRAVTVRFDAFSATGDPIVTDKTRQLELRLVSSWDMERTPHLAQWQLPIDYPPDLIQGDHFTPVMVLALSAGLLSFVLTPCMLQLVVIYIVTLTGLTVEETTRPGAIPATLGRTMFLIALSFVAGYSMLFTTAGAAIGYAGKELQLFFAEWSRSISIAAGLLVIALGLWVGVRSRAPLVCKIPLTNSIRSIDQRGLVSSALMAASFSLGCITCFGGAIIATLLIYVSTLGSPVVGASVMFAFSLGVAIPFLLAALFLSRVMPLMDHLTKYAPLMGFASMIVIFAFGAVLVTDNFHVLSRLIYPYLGLR